LYPLRRPERILADLPIGDRIGQKADGGRRPKAIREIPGEMVAADKEMKMNVGFGKHAAMSVEMLVLKQPDYVRWVLEQATPSGRMRVVQQECQRLIFRFNAKPLVKRCSGNGCTQGATRASVYKDNLTPVWWCDVCDPCQMGADAGKLQIVRTYQDAIIQVDSYCVGNRSDLKYLVKALAQAKGLPSRVGEAQAQAFFV